MFLKSHHSWYTKSELNIKCTDFGTIYIVLSFKTGSLKVDHFTKNAYTPISGQVNILTISWYQVWKTDMHSYYIISDTLSITNKLSLLKLTTKMYVQADNNTVLVIRE